MTQPGLDLGDVRLMLQGIGRCRRAQAMHAEARDLDAGDFRVMAHQGVDTIGANVDPVAWPRRGKNKGALLSTR